MTVTISILLFSQKKTMKNKLTVIIATRPNIENIHWIFKSLDIQTFQDFKVILVIDSKLKKEEFENLKKEALKWLKNISKKINFVSNVNTDFKPQNWVSNVRNYWIKLADTEFINIFDDDEIFKKDYLQTSFDLWNEIKDWGVPLTNLESGGSNEDDSQPPMSPLQRGMDDFILVPTLMFRKTWEIQSQWFDYYNFRTSRPHALRLDKNQKFAEIQMFSWNSLFGPSKIFKEILFDENFDFVYEDLEFTYRMYKAGYPLFVAKDLVLYHMERDKNILEHARVWSKFAAYRKAKHRVIFVRKNWTLLQKIKFYLLGFRAQPLRLSFKIIRYWKKREILPLIISLYRGTWDGLVYKI